MAMDGSMDGCANPAKQSRTVMNPKRRTFLGAALVAFFLCSCGTGNDYQSEGGGDPAIRFKDDAAFNASPSDAILNLAFVDQSGKEIRPRDLIGSQHLVLVFVPGFNGEVCRIARPTLPD